MTPTANWSERAGFNFETEKTPAHASRGMVVTNHPLASVAATEMLARGGNAVDAAISALFTLSVVEPMMVGIFGGGTALIRSADGRETIVDGLSTAPHGARPDCFEPVSDEWPDYMETRGRCNAVGASSVAVPGNLKAWCETLQRFGKLTLATVMEPAIRHARDGFTVTPYLTSCIETTQNDLRRNVDIASLFVPDGRALQAGSHLVQADYARTLMAIRDLGPDAMYSGALAEQIAQALSSAGSFLDAQDLARYRTIERTPVRGTYRGHEIIGPPPPCSGGVHVVQMLNLLEAYDIGAMGYGSAETTHLLLEAMKIAASDRRAVTADPDFASVPVDKLMSKEYATHRRKEISLQQAGAFNAGILLFNESANTTHVTVADDEGNIITTTQTINSLFGARIIIPGTGIIPNNYMYLFDPHPGNALSLQPGKRITSTQSPLIICHEGRPAYALGLPGGPRLYASAMQAVVNLLDHNMTLQQAVEAPRVWTQGQESELEDRFPGHIRQALELKGHTLKIVPHVAGGMCAIQFHTDQSMTGAACWRADGTPIGLGGGLARSGTTFWPDYRVI